MGANYSKFVILHQITFGDSLSPASIQNIIQVSTKFGQLESFMFDLADQEYDFSDMEEEIKILETFFISSEYPDDKIITILETDSD